jgi:glycerophosphoryl diester phosphodiesterase
MPHPYFDLPTPIILGHRGAAGVAPENTLPGFARGLADGAHIIETDVHMTRDEVPVLMHDDAVDRTTEGRGAVADLLLAEVQSLDAGHHFQGEHPDGFPMRGQGIVIPTLEETFRAFPDARFNIEIKAESPALVSRVVALTREFERADRTLLTSGEDGTQALLRAELARTGLRPAIGASVADILDVVQSAQASSAPGTDSMVLQIPREFGGSPLVTPALLAHCHAHGIQVHVWTINEPDEIRELLALGVDGIVTDHPGRMAAMLREARGGA